MYQLGDQYITITILVKICQFMREIFAKPHEKHMKKIVQHFFSHLLTSKNKIAWHTF